VSSPSTISRRGVLRAGVGLMSAAAASVLFGRVLGGGLVSATSGSTAPDACAPGSTDIVFGFSHPFAENPVVQAVKRLAKERAECHGWSVLLDETQAGNLEDQLAVVDTWITQGVDVITLLPLDPSAYTTTAQRAIDAGIIWTTYANNMDLGAGGVSFPFDVSGQVAGEAAVEWINANDPEAEVLILSNSASPEFLKRTDVPIQLIKDKTKATIVAEQDATDMANGLQVTEDVLQAHPNISVVVAMNDDAALGAAEAFRKDSGLQPDEVFIIGQDGSEEALRALQDPESYLRASAALDIADLSVETVDVAWRAVQAHWQPGDPQERLELAPTLIKNGDTELIEQFLQTYA